jgi:hypothetical protein
MSRGLYTCSEAADYTDCHGKEACQNSRHASSCWKEAATLYDTGCVVKHKLQQTVVWNNKLEAQIELLQSVELLASKKDAVLAVRLFDDVQAENTNLKNKLSCLMEKCAVEARQADVTWSELKAELVDSKQKNCTLQKCCDRIPDSVAMALAYSRFQPKPATSYNQRQLQFLSGNDRFSTNSWNRDHSCATGLHLCHGQFKYAGASSINAYQTWYNDYGKIHHEP